MRAEHHALPDAPSPSEWAHLLEYRDLAKAQRAEIDALTSARAEMMRALRHEMEERMGRTPAARPDTSNSPSEDVPLPPPQDDLTKRIKDRPTRVKTRKSLGSRSKSLNHRKKGAG